MLWFGAALICWRSTPLRKSVCAFVHWKFLIILLIWLCFKVSVSSWPACRKQRKICPYQLLYLLSLAYYLHFFKKKKHTQTGFASILSGFGPKALQNNCAAPTGGYGFKKKEGRMVIMAIWLRPTQGGGAKIVWFRFPSWLFFFLVLEETPPHKSSEI